MRRTTTVQWKQVALEKGSTFKTSSAAKGITKENALREAQGKVSNSSSDLTVRAGLYQYRVQKRRRRSACTSYIGRDVYAVGLLASLARVQNVRKALTTTLHFH